MKYSFYSYDPYIYFLSTRVGIQTQLNRIVRFFVKTCKLDRIILCIVRNPSPPLPYPVSFDLEKIRSIGKKKKRRIARFFLTKKKKNIDANWNFREKVYGREMGGRASCLTKEEHDSHGDSPSPLPLFRNSSRASERRFVEYIYMHKSDARRSLTLHCTYL